MTLPPFPTAGTVGNMPRALQALLDEIRALDAADRELVLGVLQHELDRDADPAVTAAWAEEAQRRDLEMDQGIVEPVPADEAFRSLRDICKR